MGTQANAGATCEAGENVVGWSGLVKELYGPVEPRAAIGVSALNGVLGLRHYVESITSLSHILVWVVLLLVFRSNISATLTSPVVCLYVCPCVHVCGCLGLSRGSCSWS